MYLVIIVLVAFCLHVVSMCGYGLVVEQSMLPPLASDSTWSSEF